MRSGTPGTDYICWVGSKLGSRQCSGWVVRFSMRASHWSPMHGFQLFPIYGYTFLLSNWSIILSIFSIICVLPRCNITLHSWLRIIKYSQNSCEVISLIGNIWFPGYVWMDPTLSLLCRSRVQVRLFVLFVGVAVHKTAHSIIHSCSRLFTQPYVHSWKLPVSE